MYIYQVLTINVNILCCKHEIKIITIIMKTGKVELETEERRWVGRRKATNNNQESTP